MGILETRTEMAFSGLDMSYYADHIDVTIPDGSSVRVECAGSGRINVFAADAAHDASVSRLLLTVTGFFEIGAAVRRAARAGDMTAYEVVARF